MANPKKKSTAPAKKNAAPVKKKVKRVIPQGIAHIAASFNNLQVVITDSAGNVISWASAGMQFKGPRKNTPHAGDLTAQNAAQKALQYGMREIDIEVGGPGGGREAAIRGLQKAGLAVRSIKDVTPIPHNGCRPRKRRRV